MRIDEFLVILELLEALSFDPNRLKLMDHEITLKIFGIYSQLERKSKTWLFYFPQCVCFLNRTGQNPNPQLSPPKFRYFADQNGPKGPHKTNFGNFQIRK